MDLTRISRKYARLPLVATLADGSPATIAGVDVALTPVDGRVDAATAWTPAAPRDGVPHVLLAGPDADATGALPVPEDGADLWGRVTDHPEVDVVRLDTIRIV